MLAPNLARCVWSTPLCSSRLTCGVAHCMCVCSMHMVCGCAHGLEFRETLAPIAHLTKSPNANAVLAPLLLTSSTTCSMAVAFGTGHPSCGSCPAASSMAALSCSNPKPVEGVPLSEAPHGFMTDVTMLRSVTRHNASSITWRFMMC